jgi:hypothetical protein
VTCSPQEDFVARFDDMLRATRAVPNTKALHAASSRPWADTGSASIVRAMADQAPAVPLDQQLQEIGAQLAWVRDYL